MAALLKGLSGTRELGFDRTAKLKSLIALLRVLSTLRPTMLIMEGTGICGGLACLIGRLLWSIPYIVSSGDAVAPFLRAHHPLLGLGGEIYERLLCRMSAGFIGWTPYLCGRALTFGSPRAVTAEGWMTRVGELEPRDKVKQRMRARFGIPSGQLVVGIVGSLEWNAH